KNPRRTRGTRRRERMDPRPIDLPQAPTVAWVSERIARAAPAPAPAPALALVPIERKVWKERYVAAKLPVARVSLGLALSGGRWVSGRQASLDDDEGKGRGKGKGRGG